MLHPEMLREWRNAESFHAMLVHLILPVVIIVGIVSFILKGCEPPDPEALEKENPPAESVQKTNPAANGAQENVPDAAEPEAPAVTVPGSAPQA